MNGGENDERKPIDLFAEAAGKKQGSGADFARPPSILSFCHLGQETGGALNLIEEVQLLKELTQGLPEMKTYGKPKIMQGFPRKANTPNSWALKQPYLSILYYDSLTCLESPHVKICRRSVYLG